MGGHGRERKTHIRSPWEYVLNGNPNLCHLITELMAFKGGGVGTEPRVPRGAGFFMIL